MKPELKTIPAVELYDLIKFVQVAKDCDYTTAENLIPGYVFEDCYLGLGGENIKGDWSIELREWMLDNGINMIYVFQEV